MKAYSFCANYQGVFFLILLMAISSCKRDGDIPPLIFEGTNTDPVKVIEISPDNDPYIFGLDDKFLSMKIVFSKPIDTTSVVIGATDSNSNFYWTVNAQSITPGHLVWSADRREVTYIDTSMSWLFNCVDGCTHALHLSDTVGEPITALSGEALDGDCDLIAGGLYKKVFGHEYKFLQVLSPSPDSAEASTFSYTAVDTTLRMTIDFNKAVKEESVFESMDPNSNHTGNLRVTVIDPQGTFNPIKATEDLIWSTDLKQLTYISNHPSLAPCGTECIVRVILLGRTSGNTVQDCLSISLDGDADDASGGDFITNLFIGP